MPEVISCSECDRKLRVPDDMIGKKVKCPGCGTIFVAETGDAPEPPKAARSAKSSRPSENIDTKPRAAAKRPVADDEEEDERPRKRAARDDDDEEEDRPRKRAARDDDEDDDRPRRGSRRDDDEEDEDRPKRRGRAEEDYEEEDEDDDDRSPRRAREGWKEVRKGITLVIISIFAYIGVAIITWVLQMIVVGSTMGNFAQGNIGGAVATASAMGAVMIVIQKLLQYSWMGINVFGHFTHMSPPERRGVELKNLGMINFIFAAAMPGTLLILDIVTFAMFGMGGLGGSGFGPSAAMGGGVVLIAMVILYMAAIVGGTITWLIMMRGFCQAWGNKGMAGHVKAFLITYISVIASAIVIYAIGLLVAGTVIFSSFGGGPPNAAAAGAAATAIMVLGCFTILLAIAALGLFVWYIVILFLVRGVVDQGVRRSR